MEKAEAQARAAPRAPRITNACEACRAAKVKCQASNQLGICRRCLGSKRECVFKTGPRTRRPRRPKRTDAAASSSISSATATAIAPLPPPLGPSKTFSIDIPMPAEDDITDSFEALRLSHEHAIDQLLPHVAEDEDADDHDDYDHDQDHDHDDQEGMDHDWLDSASGAGSALSHASSSSLPVSASALSTPPPPRRSTASSSTTTTTGGGSSVTSRPHAQSSQSEGGGGGGGGGGAKPTKPRTLASLRLQPQFNLDSAGQLLATFRDVMVQHFHCIVVREGEDTVAGMARERPFVLLAALAAASGSRTLQGHSLYDEEFRKVLGLKFVAGGERSLELLQGLVIYIAWYPFHLRPKNKQAFQYIRMVVDIVNDLELDQDPGTDSMEVAPAPERLEQIRLYLASYYLVTSFTTVWNRTPSLTYTEYTARCCDLLQAHSKLKGDRVLAWQVRLQRLVEETGDLRRTHRGHSQSEYQISLMIRGMETQLTEWEARMSPEIAATPSIRIATLFTRIFLSGAPLLKLPSSKYPSSLDASTAAATTSFRANPQRLLSVIPHLHALLEYFLSLPPAELNAFVGVEWAALILAVVLGFRMSFPLAVCPEWDDGAARRLLRFGEYLERLRGMGRGMGVGGAGQGQGQGQGQGEDAGNKLASGSKGVGGDGAQRSGMDVLSASQVVLEVVKRKYVKRVAAIEGPAAQRRQREREDHRLLLQQQQEKEAMPAVPPYPEFLSTAAAAGYPALPDPPPGGCPMMDGSLEPYFQYWDEAFTNDMAASAFAVPAELDAEMQQNDLWAAMTMGWAHADHMSL
ncbi:hypothetical protein VTK56DRAFT_9495 [Thermocarpiscus australiensis]